jgi:anti-sigma regulatory factor (Ser/Thr protein kinase)
VQFLLLIAADPLVVARARRHAIEVCRGLVDDGRSADIALAVSELVTNAIRHGDAPVTLTVTPRDGGVRVEVTDGNPALFVAAGGDLDEGRRGLRLIDAVCDTWGWHPVEGGKCVWCEL